MPSFQETTKNIQLTIDHTLGMGEMHTFLPALWKQEGELARIRAIGASGRIVASPENVRRVLLEKKLFGHGGGAIKEMSRVIGTDSILITDGEIWERTREVVQSPLASNTVNALAKMLSSLIDTTLVLPEGKLTRSANVLNDMKKVGLVSLMQYIFGMPIDQFPGSQKKPDQTGVSAALDFSDQIEHTIGNRFTAFFLKELLNPTPETSSALRRFLTELITGGIWPFQRMKGDLDGRAREIIQQAPKDSEHSLLSSLLEQYSPNQKDGFGSEKWLISQVISIFQAGHETSASYQTWLLYSLACHPQWQQVIRKELNALKQEGKKVDLFSLKHLLPITDALLEEVLRLFPPIPAFFRLVKEDVEFIQDGQVITVKAGESIFLAPIITHQDPSLWGDDAHEFKPERFLQGGTGDTLKKDHQGKGVVMYPFGFGERICPGASFAKLSALCVLNRILPTHHIEAEEPWGRVKMKTVGTIQPAKPLALSFHPVT